MRAFASALLGMLAALVGAACRDVVAGGVVDLGTELCDDLARCDGLQTCKLRERLQGGADDEVDASLDPFLDFAAEVDCLAGCSEARRCHDHPTVCTEAGTACATDVECCGSSERLGRCSGAGLCCGELGAACEPGREPSSCCDGVVCVPDVGGATGTCGGVKCARIGDDCARGADCCSQRCGADGTCEPSTCSAIGQGCTTDDDCCEQLLPGGATASLRCDENRRCAPPPEGCDTCDPFSPVNCCTTQTPAQVCYLAVDDSAYCGQPGCAPEGVACASDVDCCGATLACNRNGIPRCQPDCALDPSADCCQREGGSCIDDADCCSGPCIGSRCLGVDPGCVTPLCHSPLVVGPPLRADLPCELGGFDPVLVEGVCDQLPGCCCTAWTFVCAQSYLEAQNSTP
jgi:hypothetical protein